MRRRKWKPRRRRFRNLNAWQAQYLDQRWLDLRQEILKRDDFECQHCGNRGSGVVLHVHHKRYYGKHIWDVAHEDLVTLCKVCHNIVHGRKF